MIIFFMEMLKMENDERTLEQRTDEKSGVWGKIAVTTNLAAIAFSALLGIYVAIVRSDDIRYHKELAESQKDQQAQIVVTNASAEQCASADRSIISNDQSLQVKAQDKQPVNNDGLQSIVVSDKTDKKPKAVEQPKESLTLDKYSFEKEECNPDNLDHFVYTVWSNANGQKEKVAQFKYDGFRREVSISIEDKQKDYFAEFKFYRGVLFLYDTYPLSMDRVTRSYKSTNSKSQRSFTAEDKYLDRKIPEVVEIIRSYDVSGFWIDVIDSSIKKKPFFNCNEIN